MALNLVIVTTKNLQIPIIILQSMQATQEESVLRSILHNHKKTCKYQSQFIVKFAIFAETA